MYESPPVSTHPYYEIHDWDKHQPPEARNGSAKFIRNWTSLIQNPKYFMLSAAARGVLHGLWLYQGGTGLRPPRGPDRVRSVLNLGRNRYITEHLLSLERRGFLIPRTHQRRGEERREEESPPRETETKTPEQTPEPDRCESEHPWNALSDQERQWHIQDILKVHAGPAFDRMRPEIRLRTATAAAKKRMVATIKRP